ncbi:MAG: branched-chain amino acid transaminase [Myxococcota bacterium]
MVEPEFKKAPKVWLDGKLIPWEEANVHLGSHTVQYGLGVFEGIRAYKQDDGSTAIFRLQEHIQRLFSSAHILGMELPVTEEAVIEACCQVVRSSGMDSCYLRPTAFYGQGQMGLGALNNPVHVAVAAWAWGRYLGDEGMRKGTRAHVSSWQRMSAKSFLVKGKVTGQYVNSILAKREARAAGCDEAILLDEFGLVAEASGENIFIVEKNVIFTPPRSAPILDGITRDAIIHLARDMGYTVVEQSFTRGTLYCADECFFTGTAAEVTPVREVDGRAIGKGERGPVTAALQDSFFKTVRGSNPRRLSWLTKV